MSFQLLAILLLQKVRFLNQPLYPLLMKLSNKKWINYHHKCVFHEFLLNNLRRLLKIPTIKTPPLGFDDKSPKGNGVLMNIPSFIERKSYKDIIMGSIVSSYANSFSLSTIHESSYVPMEEDGEST